MKITARLVLALLVLLAGFPAAAQSTKGQWCGYALIEGVPNIERQLPILSLLVPEEKTDSNPSDLFQVKFSLDGSAAIIEGCWRIFPSRDVVLNLLGLSVGAEGKESVDQQMTYSLFAPDGSREDSAATVREYLSKNLQAWELPEDERGAETK